MIRSLLLAARTDLPCLTGFKNSGLRETGRHGRASPAKAILKERMSVLQTAFKLRTPRDVVAECDRKIALLTDAVSDRTSKVSSLKSPSKLARQEQSR